MSPPPATGLRAAHAAVVAALAVVAAVGAGAASFAVGRSECARGAGTPLQDCPLGVAAQRAGDPETLRKMLVATPLDGTLHRDLARVAAARGNRADADRLYAIALRRAPRDLPAYERRLEQALRAGRPVEAAHHLDRLLSLDEASAAQRLAAAAPHLAQAGFREALAERLRRGRKWRDILPAVLRDASDPVPAAGLLAAIAEGSSTPAFEREVLALLLERSGRMREARLQWREALPPTLRRHDAAVFDGSFEAGDGPAPYAWRFEPAPGVIVGIDSGDAAAGTHALVLAFDGRAVDFGGVTQDLVLDPGRHVLHVGADIRLDGERPLTWFVQCRPGDAELAQLDLPSATRGWRTFQQAFAVPAGCPTQRLRFMAVGRDLAERQVGGEVRFDRIRIERAPTPRGVR